MQKIISLFERDYKGTRLVYDEVVPGAEWVWGGEGVATRKWDGTACMVRDGRLFKRYEVKKGKVPPGNFEAAQNPDPITGECPGWVPVGEGPEDRWHREAFDPELVEGTYELVGPKVQRNPEGLARHTLIPHGKLLLHDAPRDFEGLRNYFLTHNIEGIVWWHPDGRMVKIKARDFGLQRAAIAKAENGDAP